MGARVTGLVHLKFKGLKPSGG
jgi:hypothetical protein